jgi:hypothetical protein
MAFPKIHLRGLNTVVKNINKQVAKTSRDAQRAVARMGELVKSESELRTPIDTGLLISSIYMQKFLRKDLAEVEIGYDLTKCDYALYVHENLTNRHGSDRVPIPGRPTEQAKFLEDAVIENEKRLLKIVYEETRIK